MTQWIQATLITALFFGILTACATGSPEQPSSQSQEDIANEQVEEGSLTEMPLDDGQPPAKEEVLLAEHPDASIRVTGVEQEDQGIYSPITVQWSEMSNTFDWVNVVNPTYAPRLSLSDLDRDGHEELILILTTGYGTGVYASEAHILREDLTEIHLPDPMADAEQVITHSVSQQEDTRTFTLTVNEEAYTYTYLESDTRMWYDQVVLKNHRRHRIDNGYVIASMAAELGHGVSPGRVEVAYELWNDEFELADIQLVEMQ